MNQSEMPQAATPVDPQKPLWPAEAVRARLHFNQKALFLGAAGVIVLVGLIAILALLQMRQLTNRQTALVTQNMAKLMEQTYDGLIDTIDIAVLASSDEITRQLKSGKIDALSVREFLNRQQQRVPQIAYIRASNAEGDVVLGPNMGASRPNVSDREYFQRLQSDPSAPLYVSKALVGRTNGRWVWTFVRRINTPDGGFAGVVFASILLDDIDKMLAKTTLHAGDVATLRDSGLGVIARHVFEGNAGAMPGDTKLSNPFAAALQANPKEGTYISGASSIDAISRTQSYRSSQKYGYYVNVGISNDAALTVWRKQVLVVGGLFAAFTLLTVIFSNVVARGWQRQSRDVQALREAHQKAHYEQELLHALMDNVPDQIFFKDRQSRFIRVNPALAKKYGIDDPTQAFGKSDEDYYGAAHAEKTAADERQIMRTGQPLLGIVDQEVWPDGSRTWNLCSKLPFYDSKGELVGTYGIAHDITEQLETQARLKEANESLEQRVDDRTRQLALANQELSQRQEFIRTIADAVPSMIGYWDRELHCKFANKAYEKWFDVRVETIVGMHIRDVLGEHLFALNEPRLLLALQGELQVFDREALRANGEVGYMAAKYIPHVTDGQVVGFFVLVEDITELKLAEFQQAKLNAELAVQVQAASDASLAKSEFLANMSHEIRTPLSAISGMAKLIAKEPLSANQAEKMAKLEAAVKHLSFTINDILDLSKIEANRLLLEQGRVDMQALVANVASMTQDSLQAKGLQLQVQVDAMPANLIGDTTRLSQALLNYLGNAVKFTNAGSVRLRACVVEETADSALIRLEVQDTGVGIPPEKLPHLFEPFVQADATTTRRYGGSGLGLAITKRLVLAMGGEVGVSSQWGWGSTFWFSARLGKGPVAESVVEQQTQEAAALTLRSTHAGQRVLLVEDDEFNREIGTILLQDVGLLVDTAEDGQAAVEMAARTAYDLVLMDMQMPRLDGLEATRRIRGATFNNAVPIIAMTANAFMEDRRLCMDAGMNDFITKPVDPLLLYQAITRLLARRGA